VNEGGGRSDISTEEADAGKRRREGSLISLFKPVGPSKVFSYLIQTSTSHLTPGRRRHSGDAENSQSTEVDVILGSRLAALPEIQSAPP
jgi:hypothetical protein